MISKSLSSRTPLQSHTAFEAVRMFSKSRSALSFLDNRELFTVPNVITLSRYDCFSSSLSQDPGVL